MCISVAHSYLEPAKVKVTDQWKDWPLPNSGTYNLGDLDAGEEDPGEKLKKYSFFWCDKEGADKSPPLRKEYRPFAKIYRGGDQIFTV